MIVTVFVHIVFILVTMATMKAKTPKQVKTSDIVLQRENK